MAYNLDYTSTADLLAAYKEERPATTFLKDRYFPDGINFATNEVIVEYKKGRRVLAPFVAPEINGKVMKRNGYIAKSFADKQGFDAYPIGGTHANHAITLLDIATCMFQLGKTEGIDDLIEKAKHIYFDTYNHMELRDYNKTMHEMVNYFTKEYNKKKLNEYKPLDLGEIEKRIAQKDA